jgi:putative transposase
VKGSKNWKKAQIRLARLYYRIRCRRQDAAHKMTHSLTKQARVIGMEDLNVVGMVKNHHLAQAVHDASFGEIKRQMTYKAAASGGQIVRIDRFFPSSKRCNECGQIQEELRLDVREWVCSNCGLRLDRDLNAARNIRDEAMRLMGLPGSGATSGNGKNACGQRVRPH